MGWGEMEEVKTIPKKPSQLSLPRQPVGLRWGTYPADPRAKVGCGSAPLTIAGSQISRPPPPPLSPPLLLSFFPFGKAPDGHPPEDTPPTLCLFAAAPRTYLVEGAVGCCEVGLGRTVHLVHNIQTAHGWPLLAISFFLINSCSAKWSSASQEGGSRRLRGTTHWWEE